MTLMRNMSGSLFLKIMVVYSMARTSLSSCDPEVTCSTAGAGNKVPDPADCHNYYVCITDVNGDVHPSDQPVTCKNLFYFNPHQSQCQLEVTPCYKPCPNLECSLECDNSLSSDLVADPNDCNKFYLCLPGLPPSEISCSDSEPYFNGEGCSDDPQECCDFCIPWCKSTYSETQDPFDCESYYLCLESTGIPSESDHHKCESGKYFNTTTNMCSFYEDGTNKCEPLCLSDISTTSATTKVPETESPTQVFTSQTTMVASQTTKVTSQTPMVTSQIPMVTSQTPMVTSQTPMVTSQTPMVTTETPMVTTETPMVTSQIPIVTSQTPMVTSQTLMVTTETPMVTTEKTEATSVTKTTDPFVPPKLKINSFLNKTYFLYPLNHSNRTTL